MVPARSHVDTDVSHTDVSVCVFQVETIGDAYMVVAGAPEKTKYHAHNICDMAVDMVRSIDHLKDPSNGNNIQIRVGTSFLIN